MSDALPLPPRPQLDHYKKLARDLQQACRSPEPGAVKDWAARWLTSLFRLQEHDQAPGDRQPAIARESARVEGRWQAFGAAARRARCLLADAQFFIAREHGFASWPAFAAHVETITHPDSPVARFEAAVDAIITGNAPALRRLLHAHPGLVTARSTRQHQSTLLHYVSANGVEDFRQRTPPNIVEITRLLLEAGADVNAASDAYGGGSTALGLAATSLHPEQAGVQAALLDMLLAHGAAIAQAAATDDGSAVTGCLANGQLEAARHLAARGAVLNFSGAAGIGRLDVVRTLAGPAGALLPQITGGQLAQGLLYACGYGHADVVQFLLESGVDPDLRSQGGETGLHWASFGPHPEIARLLLARGATIAARDARFNGTPLDWALFAWARATGEWRERGYELVRLLVDAGATVHVPWLEPDGAAQVRSDPRMREILVNAMDAIPPDRS